MPSFSAGWYSVARARSFRASKAGREALLWQSALGVSSTCSKGLRVVQDSVSRFVTNSRERIGKSLQKNSRRSQRCLQEKPSPKERTMFKSSVGPSFGGQVCIFYGLKFYGSKHVVIQEHSLGTSEKTWKQPQPSRVAIFFACYRGHLGPSGPKSRKVRKWVPGAKSERVQKESKKSPKLTILTFGLFLTPFRLFDPRAREPIFGLFWTLVPKGPNEPCSRRRRSKFSSF